MVSYFTSLSLLGSFLHELSEQSRASGASGRAMRSGAEHS